MNMLKAILLLATVSTALVGCGDSGPKTYPVSGTVSYDSNVVPTGMVMFIGEGSAARVNATIGADGTYKLSAPAGQYRVVVNAMREAPQKSVTKENWKEAFEAAPEPYVPAVYGDPETTSLTATVEASEENKIDLNIPPLKRHAGGR